MQFSVPSPCTTSTGFHSTGIHGNTYKDFTNVSPEDVNFFNLPLQVSDSLTSSIAMNDLPYAVPLKDSYR